MIIVLFGEPLKSHKSRKTNRQANSYRFRAEKHKEKSVSAHPDIDTRLLSSSENN